MQPCTHYGLTSRVHTLRYTVVRACAYSYIHYTSRVGVCMCVYARARILRPHINYTMYVLTRMGG